MASKIISDIHQINTGTAERPEPTDIWVQSFDGKGDHVIVTRQAVHIDALPALIETLQKIYDQAKAPSA